MGLFSYRRSRVCCRLIRDDTMEDATESSLLQAANLSQEMSLYENKNGEIREQQETEEEEALREKADGLESVLQEAYELQRRTKRDLRREERRLIWLQEELDETLRTIRDDRQRIMALHNEQSFTAKQIKDALSIDLKHYEATLRSKQPDLYGYCRQVTNARDCLVIIHSIRQCRRHIQLAEILIAHRYASFLSEKPLSMTSPYATSHSTAAVTPTPTKASADGQSPVSTVQSSPLCPALASGGGGGGTQSSLHGVRPSQVPVLRYPQGRTKTEKTKPRRLSLVKVDHRTTPSTPVTTAPATTTTTTPPIASSADRMTTAAAAVTTTTTSTTMSSSSSASTSHGSLASPTRTEWRDAAGGAVGGGSASTDVVRIEMRECESRPMWIAARDVKPIVLTYVTK